MTAQSSARFCAFLRGVNVKGTSMKMADVCAVFERSGVSNVSSVLASGNIMFSTHKTPEAVKKMLEDAMGQHFGYDAHLFVYELMEVERIWASRPFHADPDFHCYAFLGSQGVEEILWQEYLKSAKAEGEEAALVDGTFYWKTPKGTTLESSFGKILGQKRLRDRFTSRNVNTLQKIVLKKW